jgi:MSHA pilin protein MshA
MATSFPRTLTASPRRPTPGRQRGFTLVELITVILILGVLAAIAVPRYSDLQARAREGKLKALLGSIKTAAALVKAQAVASGKSCTSWGVDSVSMDGRTIPVGYCFPYADTAPGENAILVAAGVDLGSGDQDATLPDYQTPDGYTIQWSNAGTTLWISMTGAATLSGCRIGYASPEAPGGDIRLGLLGAWGC